MKPFPCSWCWPGFLVAACWSGPARTAWVRSSRLAAGVAVIATLALAPWGPGSLQQALSSQEQGVRRLAVADSQLLVGLVASQQVAGGIVEDGEPCSSPRR